MSPLFLEKDLEKEYKNKPKKEREHAVWGTLNKIGAVRGNKETAKGRAMEKKHKKDMGAKHKALMK